MHEIRITMKRIAIIAALLLAASCSVTRDRATLVTFASFSDYPDMWISPNDCPMVHTALGVLEIDITPALIVNKGNGDGIYSTQRNTASFERIYYDELLGIAVKEARARGANGISNLRITSNQREGETFATRYKVEGLLLRIE